MKVHLLEREQWLARPIEEAFPFFADAGNLERITPPWLGFRMVTPLPVEMRRDAGIAYRLRLAGIPVRWRTRIAAWEPPYRFVDVQERGPYALWEHEHLFRPLGEGVLMTDRVRYALPLGPLGRLAHALAVRAALAAIFDFRFQAVQGALAVRVGAEAAARPPGGPPHVGAGGGRPRSVAGDQT